MLRLMRRRGAKVTGDADPEGVEPRKRTQSAWSRWDKERRLRTGRGSATDGPVGTDTPTGLPANASAAYRVHYAITVPTVQDRLIQQALRRVLNAAFDQEMSAQSWGSRPGCSAHDAVTAARGYVASCATPTISPCSCPANGPPSACWNA